MKVTLTFTVECKSVQHATALRDKHSALLSEDPDVHLIDANVAQRLRPFTVVGVDTSTKESFHSNVDAKDEDDAKGQVIGTSKTKIVAEVRAQ